jgi:predicted dithiol-disulfide oxidoreductase (DUF899 family)
MTEHRTASREAWLAARLDLLKEEKELTRRSDALARKRQELPWVRINKPYRFETDQGAASLADLFKGRSQLIVYHFMFGPDYEAGCPSCSAIADGFNGIVVHLENHDVAFSAVSRAPLARLQAYKQRMGWTFPWASSLGDDFNFDFNVSFTEEQQRNEGIEFNYTREPPLQSRSDGEPVDAIASRATPDGRARETGREHVRDRGRRHLPQLFRLFARRGWPVGHVPVARPRAQGTQRDRWCVVASPRQVRPALRLPTQQAMQQTGG